MTPPILYLTGTNTAVGKTTLAMLLLRRARERNLRIAALKPFCSGGREDAEQLLALQSAGLTLDEVNPFHFSEPITPALAAKNAHRRITLSETLQHLQTILQRGHPVIVEGAGGLMSPLGEKFTLLDVIRELPGPTIIVGQNILGVINSALLTARALDSVNITEKHFVLMAPSEPDASTPTNAAIISEWTGCPVHELPFLKSLATEHCSPLDTLLSLLSC